MSFFSCCVGKITAGDPKNGGLEIVFPYLNSPFLGDMMGYVNCLGVYVFCRCVNADDVFFLAVLQITGDLLTVDALFADYHGILK